MRRAGARAQERANGACSRRYPARGVWGGAPCWGPSSHAHPPRAARKQVANRTYERAAGIDLDGVESQFVEDGAPCVANLLHLALEMRAYVLVRSVDDDHLAALE